MGRLWKGEGSETFCPWCVDFSGCRPDEEDWDTKCPKYTPELTILCQRCDGLWDHFSDSNLVSFEMSHPGFVDSPDFGELITKGEVVVNSGPSGIYKIIKRTEGL